MKRFLLLLLGICSLGKTEARIVIEARPPQVPEKAPLVQVARWPMSFASFQRRAAQLGVRGEVSRSPRGLVLRSGALLFNQDMMGTEFFADTSRFMAEPPGALQPLPDEEAIKLANEFVRKNPGRLSLNFEEVKFQRVSHMFNQGEDLLKQARTPVTQDESIVIFNRHIEGIPVISAGGLGDQVRVHIANDGAVVGQRQVWRNARPTGEFLAVRPYDDALKQLVEQLTQEAGGNELMDTIVSEVQFGLYSREEGQPQEFMQPAYLFKVLLFSNEEKQTTGARMVAIPGIDPRLMKEPLDPPLPPPENGNREKIVFKAEPPPLPAALPAVQIVPIVVNPDTVQRRAIQLGLSQGKLVETPRGLAFTDERLLLFHDPQGTELFGDMTRMMAEAPGEGTPISDREAIAIAMESIKAMQDVDPEALGQPIVRRLHQQSFDTQNQKLGPQTMDEAIVEFPRQIPVVGAAPIPCVGPGAFLRIHVDNAGKPTGHHRVWRQLNLQSSEPLKLREVGEIQEEFVRELLSSLGSSIGMVTEIKAGLYMRGEGMDQRYAQPALVYEVDIIDEATGEVTAHRQIPVPAAPRLMGDEPLDDPNAQPGVTDPNLQDARSPDAIPLLFGDMNNNGQLGLDDVVIAIQFAGGLASPESPAQVAAGDVAPAGATMGDGSVRLNDALRVLRGVLKLDTLEPDA